MSGILGQAAPAAASWEDLFTVPAATVAAVRVIVSNRGASDATFRIVVAPLGAVTSNEMYISGGSEGIPGNQSASTIGFIVSSTDVIRVYSSNGALSFTVTGESRVE